jgi:PAS domain-containing protein
MKLTTLLRSLLTRSAGSREEYGPFCNDPRPVLGCDWKGRVVLCNRAAEHLSGWAAAEVLGKPLEVFLRPSELPRSSDGAVLSTNEGTPMAVMVSVGPLKDSRDKVVGSLYVMRPVPTGGDSWEHPGE